MTPARLLASLLLAGAVHGATISPSSMLVLRLCSESAPYTLGATIANVSCELTLEEWSVSAN